MSFGLQPTHLIILVITCLPILLIVAVLAILIAILIQVRRQSGQPASLCAPDALKARYARGEITREQFEQIKRDLGG